MARYILKYDKTAQNVFMFSMHRILVISTKVFSRLMMLSYFVLVYRVQLVLPGRGDDRHLLGPVAVDVVLVVTRVQGHQVAGPASAVVAAVSSDQGLEGVQLLGVEKDDAEDDEALERVDDVEGKDVPLDVLSAKLPVQGVGDDLRYPGDAHGEKHLDHDLVPTGLRSKQHQTI